MVNRIYYRKVEMSYVNVTRICVCIISFLFVLAGFLAFVPFVGHSFVVALHVGLILSFTGLLMREYISVHIRFLYLAYTCQRYEFNKHAFRDISLNIILVACMAILFFLNFQDIFNISCSIFIDNWPAQDEVNAGICSVILDFKANETNAQENFNLLVAHIAQDAPFFFYILLAKPHDCYECYSVQPGLRISIFQFNEDAKTARRIYSRASIKLNSMSISMARNASPEELRRTLNTQTQLTLTMSRGGTVSTHPDGS